MNQPSTKRLLTEANAAVKFPPKGGVFVDVVNDYGAKVDGTTDDTTAWQNAINYVVTQGGGTVYCSKFGRSMIKGAQQTGTQHGYAYSGQILFPARDYTAGRAVVKIQGPVTPPLIPIQDSPAEPTQATSCLTFVSNATAGNVFDAIPSAITTASGGVFTDIHLLFQDVALLAPPNPAVNGINATVIASFATDQVLLAVNSDSNGGGTITNTGIGIITPAQLNEAFVDLRRTSVNFFATAIKMSEHTHLDSFLVRGCNTAMSIYGAGGGHTIKLTKVLVQATAQILTVDSATTYDTPILGSIDIENIVTMMINDPNNRLVGELTIYNAVGQSKGWPAIGAQKIRLRAWAGNDTNSMPDNYSSAPWDNFTRTADVVGILGTTDQSRHVWHNSKTLACSWTTSGGAAKASTFQGISTVLLSHYMRNNGSRMVTGRFVLPASGYDFGLALGFIQNDYSGIVVGLYSGQIQIKRYSGNGSTSLANSATGLWTGAGTHTIQAVITTSPVPGSSTTIAVYLDGATTAALTYTLVAADITALTESSPTRIKRDGLYAGTADTTSTCTLFKVDAI